LLLLLGLVFRKTKKSEKKIFPAATAGNISFEQDRESEKESDPTD